ncbi:tRNA (adenosine(37)-N6)-dimethylallyltransferase MiaA [Flavobacteriaceae bacterium]|nr:tRNA (adenosine(37)-N6)-dimethylallyltransferase MiaA [Flavobacteriaceae bacterium]|tara:strand:- start:2180 stop:3073 length:894 start_codon:yes stop_codon:yes gene_type:complete
MSTNTLIYIAGPTGVGKTKLSLELAKCIDTEIISCDSRQFYKEMNIGTAVPTTKELKEVRHHFIHNKSIKDIYTVVDFEKEAIKKLNLLFKKKETIIMVGGSGMYADALMFGMDEFPEVPKEIRNQINVFYKSHGLKGLQELLRDKDPKYYTRVDINNPVRLIRALEVCLTSKKPFSSFLGKYREPRDFISKIFILECPRKILYEKINSRVDQMMTSGLENEVRKLIDFKELPTLKTVGYKELFPYFQNKKGLEDAILEIKKNSRRYAKRQITWFKKYDNSFIISSDTSAEEILSML